MLSSFRVDRWPQWGRCDADSPSGDSCLFIGIQSLFAPFSGLNVSPATASAYASPESNDSRRWFFKVSADEDSALAGIYSPSTGSVRSVWTWISAPASRSPRTGSTVTRPGGSSYPVIEIFCCGGDHLLSVRDLPWTTRRFGRYRSQAMERASRRSRARQW